MRSEGLVLDTIVCLTLAKWETVSGRFGGYLSTDQVKIGELSLLLSDGERILSYHEDRIRFLLDLNKQNRQYRLERFRFFVAVSKLPFAPDARLRFEREPSGNHSTHRPYHDTVAILGDGLRCCSRVPIRP